MLPERGELAPFLQDAGAEVIVHPLAVLRRRVFTPSGLLHLAGTARLDARALASLARERGAALVHSNTSVVVAGRAAARHAEVPHVQHVREIYKGVRGASLWPLWRRQLERSDAVVAVSQAVAAQFRHATVIHDGLPRTAHRAPRTEARKTLGVPNDAFVVALLGRVSDWKGQDVLARALAAAPNVIGLVAGDVYPGEERQQRKIEKLAGELELGDRLRFLGFREDVEVVLGAADAVVVPSKRPDPLPNSALEAAAAGLPVVASSHGGLPEIVRDGETGLLVPPGDHEALAAALQELSADPGRTARMGAAGAAEVRARFAPERMLDQLQDRWDDLVSR